MDFGKIVIVSFIISVLLALTMNAALRYERDGPEGLILSAAAWVIGLIAWIVWHRRSMREREKLEEELRQDSTTE